MYGGLDSVELVLVVGEESPLRVRSSRLPNARWTLVGSVRVDQLPPIVAVLTILPLSLQFFLCLSSVLRRC